ncbi:MAG: hypothetical protein PHI53_03780 [Candidatus Pacebacteria bacterium]|nr:hypothetical protein [Candidatus Paceibacterota bacterium]
MTLSNQIKRLPDKPGVYIFLGEKDAILYIGRALSLKKRVLNYFQKILDPRIRKMIDSAKGIKFYQTDNLLEAVILEANLIKKYWPRYNIKEKDNRSFIYIIIPKTDYPRPMIVRQRELERFSAKAYVFGPYQSYFLLNKALRIIRRIFPYSTCVPFSGKPCFNYQIGLCPGLCVGRISKKDYQKNIRNIILLLSGQKKKLFDRLKKENPEAVYSLKHIQDVSLIQREESGSFYNVRVEGYDISHLTGKETFGAMSVFFNGEPEKDQYRLFKIKEAPQFDDLRALEEVIARRLKHKEWPFPNIILIDGGRPQIDFISKILEKNNLNIPLVGISKFGNDKLVFPKDTKKSVKELIEGLKEVLLKVRNEAHRFGLKASRRKRFENLTKPPKPYILKSVNRTLRF